jgi:hypothetical protein
MDHQQELEAIARGIIDSNLYMVLGTADEAGHPWVSPVYYAPGGYTEFYWVSSPEAAHSRNLSARPELSIVIFNSQVPIGTGQGVYVAAAAREVAGRDLDGGIEVFSQRSLAHGGSEWTLKDVQPPERLRLFRAIASEHWVLDPDVRGDHRTPVTP